jgi:hypothetical protein
MDIEVDLPFVLQRGELLADRFVFIILETF